MRLRHLLASAALVAALAALATIAVRVDAQSTKKPGVDVQVQPNETWFKRLCSPTTTSADVGVERDAAGVFRVTDCSESASLRDVKLRALSFLLGGSSTAASSPAAGLNDPTSTASGTVQNTEYVLNSVTIPASAFNTNTRGISCDAWGTGAANANAKNYKFYFGSTAVVTLTGTTDSAKDYSAHLTVLRSGASTQTGFGSIASDVGAEDAKTVNGSLAQTDTAAIIVAFKAANTAAAAASATGKGLHCTFVH